MSKKQDRLKNGTNKFMPGKVAALGKWNNKPLLDKMIDDSTPVKELVAWCNDNASRSAFLPCTLTSGSAGKRL